MIVYAGTFSSTSASAKLIQITLTGQAYCAADQSICGTAPEEMTLLMDFVRDMTNSIKTIGTEWDYLGQYVNANRFKWETFEPPVQGVASKLARNLAQKIKFAIATTAILSNPVNFAWLKDIAWWTVLLTKNKIFLRDSTIIEELESSLSAKKYELGVWGWYGDQINAENRQIMNGIIKKYKDQLLFLDPSTIAEWATYTNVTSLLTQMLSSAKTFLYFDTTSQFDSITRWGIAGVTITFNTVFMKNIATKYSCARGVANPCDPALKDFWKNLKNIWKDSFTKASQSIVTFGDAGKRLGEIFKKNQSPEFKEREADLIRSMYWTTQVSQSSWIKGLFIDPFKKTLESIKKSWSEVAQNITAGADSVSKFWQFPATIKGAKELPEDKEKSIDLEGIDQSSYAYPEAVFTQMMQWYINDVFDNQKADLELVQISDVTEVTPAFVVLWDQIKTIKEDILGGKQKKNTLFQNLWVASELQCSQ